MPYEPDTQTLAAPVHKNMGRSSMSVLTSLTLSFNNLRTKKARTLLTAFAGSIGIIGPIRMDYAAMVAETEYFARLVGELLTEIFEE